MAKSLLGVFVVVGTLHAQPIPGIHLSDGTLVELQARSFMASWRSRPGDRVVLQISRDVLVDGLVVIERGTPVEGVIVEAGPGDMVGRRPARLAFVVEATTSVVGETVRLRPTPIRVTHRYRHPYLLWADVTSTFTALIDGEHWVTGRQPQRQPTLRSFDIILPPPSDQLTNEDVLKLVEAGMSEEVILAKIQISSPAFDLDAQALIELKERGVPDRVLLAMIEAAAAR